MLYMEESRFEIDWKKEYDELLREFESLQHDYSENTIVQSMNDMKDRYNALVRNTVPLQKYSRLEENFESLRQKANAAVVLIEHTVEQLKEIEKSMFSSSNLSMYRAELGLVITKEILENSLKNK